MRLAPQLVLLLFVLSGCASFTGAAPGVEANQAWFCKPDSAVRYRGKVPSSGNFGARPAPKHGSCRNQ
ncbi:MAG: hypothetical protein AAGA23_23970 [Pseudomonadota bacterium]